MQKIKRFNIPDLHEVKKGHFQGFRFEHLLFFFFAGAVAWASECEKHKCDIQASVLKS